MAARTFTIDQLISRAQKLTDTENDQHISSAEWFEIMNSALAETWDVMCDSGLAEKFVKSASFSSVAGQREYPLFTIAPDFYRIHQVYVDEGNNQLRPLQRIAPSEFLSFTPPPTAVPLKLYYIPYCPILTTGQTFDGVNGWEEHSLMTAACAAKMKKEDSWMLFAQRKRELEDRMHKMGNVDFGEAPRVVRKYGRKNDPWFMYRSNVSCYCVRGDKIELLYDFGYLP